MDNSTKEFKVVITKSAEIAFYDILNYALKNHTTKRALKIAEELLDLPSSLSSFPYIGKLENDLINVSKQYRFILYNRTPTEKIKLIYFVNEIEQTVYVVDYFPCKMNPLKMEKRLTNI
jgi:plasmid stabilization system protein ParE